MTREVEEINILNMYEKKLKGPFTFPLVSPRNHLSNGLILTPNR